MEGEPLDNNLYIPLSAARSRFGDVLMRRSAGSQEIEKIELHQLTVQMRDVAAVETADPQIKTLRHSVRINGAHAAGREAGRTVILHKPVEHGAAGAAPRLLRS